MPAVSCQRPLSFPRARACFWAFSLLSTGCSLTTDFDQENKPCDGYQQCEDGYYCQIQDDVNGTGICVKSASKAIPERHAARAEGEAGASQDEVAVEWQPCVDNACVHLKGHICDAASQLCVPQT